MQTGRGGASLVAVAATAALLLISTVDPANGEVYVDELPTWGHQVEGQLYIIDETTLVIREFQYDHGGPDAYLYYYETGNNPPYTADNIPRDGGGQFIDHPDTSNGKFPFSGQLVSGVTLQFSLPQGVYACDMAVFTIWCQLASSHFTGVDIPQSLFTTDPSEAADGTKILCTRGVDPEPVTEEPQPEPSETTEEPQPEPSETPEPQPSPVPTTPDPEPTGGPVPQPSATPDPEPTEIPQPVEVCLPDPLPDFSHGVRGQLCILDQSTLLIRGFYYDGGGPDAHLYAYPIGDNPRYTAANVQDEYRTGVTGAFLIPYPETGEALPFRTREIVNETVRLHLPDGKFACDIAVFTVWCRRAGVQFSALEIPSDLFTSDANEAAEGNKIFCTSEGREPTEEPSVEPEFENCQQLDPSLNLEWTVDRDAEEVMIRLCGCTSSDIAQDNTWLGFGLSGSDAETQMFGADATIVWVDDEDGPQAVDYYLSDYSQCRGGVGACPDSEDSSGACSNDVTLVSGTKKDGIQCVIYSRNFAAGDDRCDIEIKPETDQFIVWGVGGLGETAFRHFVNAQRGDDPLSLGREPSRNCAPLECAACAPYQNQRLAAASDETFVARIGPSGNQRGYMAITGRAGWGIAWYINGTLIPELVVQRGKTYTFVVYGGDNERFSAQYHPFYITDSRSGGYLLNEKDNGETIYAGFDDNKALGVGPLCEFTTNPRVQATLDNCQSVLAEYESILTPPAPACGQGIVNNTFTWTPDENTPDLVYYQCASHLNLGHKIRVQDIVGISDTGEVESSASPVIPASLTFSLLAAALLYALS